MALRRWRTISNSQDVRVDNSRRKIQPERVGEAAAKHPTLVPSQANKQLCNQSLQTTTLLIKQNSNTLKRTHQTSSNVKICSISKRFSSRLPRLASLQHRIAGDPQKNPWPEPPSRTNAMWPGGGDHLGSTFDCPPKTICQSQFLSKNDPKLLWHKTQSQIAKTASKSRHESPSLLLLLVTHGFQRSTTPGR